MKTISVLDLKGKYAKKLAAHLKSEDFFSVSKYKTSELHIKKVKHLGKSTYQITAELKIKGIVQKVSFKGTFKGKKFSGSFLFNRTTHNIRYKSKTFFSNLGDKFIKDNVLVEFTVFTK